MVHVRFNEKEANPNPHINFITPLKMADTEVEEEARQLLRALAAQVRPIMKAEGFVVNSFEEVRAENKVAYRGYRSKRRTNSTNITKCSPGAIGITAKQ